MLRKLFIALVLMAAGLYFFFGPDREQSEGLLLWDPAAEAREIEVKATDRQLGATDEAREDAAGAVGTVGAVVRGRVLQVDGTPLGGVAIALQHPYLRSRPASSTADGSFEVQVEEPRGELGIVGDEWILLGGERFLAASHADGYSLVVTPARAIAGRVVDRAGEPLRGATVRALVPKDALVPLGIVSKPLVDPRQSAVSDTDGHFKIAAPVLTATRVEVALPGHRTLELLLASLPDTDVSLVLSTH